MSLETLMVLLQYESVYLFSNYYIVKMTSQTNHIWLSLLLDEFIYVYLSCQIVKTNSHTDHILIVLLPYELNWVPDHESWIWLITQITFKWIYLNINLFFFLVWICLCLIKSPDCEKDFSHKSLLTKFTLVWINLCIFFWSWKWLLT